MTSLSPSVARYCHCHRLLIHYVAFNDCRKLEHEKKLQKVRERLYREEVEILRGKGAKDSEGDENENVNSKRLLGSGTSSGQKNANAQGSSQPRQQYAAAAAK